MDKNSPPKVSICIPAYNQGRYLGEALASALHQNYSDYEILVLDNASTDTTREVVKSFKDPRLSYYRNPRTVGVIRNYNLCLKKARGRYIKFLHADDVLKPDALGELARVLDEHPKVGLVHCWSEFINEQSQVQGLSAYPDRDRLWPGQEMAVESLSAYNFIGGPSLVMFRSEDVKRVGCFDLDLVQVADWELWLRLLAEFQGYSLARGLVQYRIHQHSYTTHNMRTNRGIFEEYSMLNKSAHLSELPAFILSNLYWRVHANALVNMKGFIERENYGQAVELCLDILDLDRFLGAYEFGGCQAALEKVFAQLRQRRSPGEILGFLKRQKFSRVYQAIFTHGVPFNVEVFNLLLTKRSGSVIICGTGNVSQFFANILSEAGIKINGYLDPGGNRQEYQGRPVLREINLEALDGLILACDDKAGNLLVRRQLLDQTKSFAFLRILLMGYY